VAVPPNINSADAGIVQSAIACHRPKIHTASGPRGPFARFSTVIET
jgi:hypothetical protein